MVDTIVCGSFYRILTLVAFPGAAFQFEMTLSYDKFNDAYRVLLFDDINGYLDLYSGEIINQKPIADNIFQRYCSSGR